MINHEEGGHRDIVLRPRNGGRLRKINETNPNYDPLSYPLLFPRGERGWHLNLSYGNGNGIKLTQLQWSAFYLQVRERKNVLHLAGRLFQQYVVDSFAKIEQSRMGFIENNQRAFSNYIEINFYRKFVLIYTRGCMMQFIMKTALVLTKSVKESYCRHLLLVGIVK